MSERSVIQSIRQGKILTTALQTSVYEAACIMTDANCGSVLVVDATGSLVGIVTERDLMNKVIAQGLDAATVAVSEIMTKNPRYVSPDTSVAEAVLIMKDGGFRHLPVLSSARRIVGVFSMRDASATELGEAERRAEYLDVMSDSVAY